MYQKNKRSKKSSARKFSTRKSVSFNDNNFPRFNPNRERLDKKEHKLFKKFMREFANSFCDYDKAIEIIQQEQNTYLLKLLQNNIERKFNRVFTNRDVKENLIEYLNNDRSFKELCLAAVAYNSGYLDI